MYRQSTLPGIAGNPSGSLAQLTPEEDKAWVFAFTYYIDEGHSDLEADRLAWRDVQQEFPRLRAFEGATPNSPENVLDDVSGPERHHNVSPTKALMDYAEIYLCPECTYGILKVGGRRYLYCGHEDKIVKPFEELSDYEKKWFDRGECPLHGDKLVRKNPTKSQVEKVLFKELESMLDTWQGFIGRNTKFNEHRNRALGVWQLFDHKDKVTIGRKCPYLVNLMQKGESYIGLERNVIVQARQELQTQNPGMLIPLVAGAIGGIAGAAGEKLIERFDKENPPVDISKEVARVNVYLLSKKGTYVENPDIRNALRKFRAKMKGFDWKGWIKEKAHDANFVAKFKEMYKRYGRNVAIIFVAQEIVMNVIYGVAPAMAGHPEMAVLLWSIPDEALTIPAAIGAAAWLEKRRGLKTKFPKRKDSKRVFPRSIGRAAKNPPEKKFLIVTRGFEEDTDLRDQYLTDSFVLWSTFETPEDAVFFGEKVQEMGNQVRYVKHISSAETGQRPSYELYLKWPYHVEYTKLQTGYPHHALKGIKMVNPEFRIKMTNKELFAKMFENISKVYPGLDKKHFQYSYNLGIAAMPLEDRNRKKLKPLLVGMSKEEKEEINLQLIKTDWTRYTTHGTVYLTNPEHTVAFHEDWKMCTTFITDFKTKKPLKYKRWKKGKLSDGIQSFYDPQNSKIRTQTSDDIYEDIVKRFFISAKPEIYGNTGDWPFILRHPEQNYGFLVAPRLESDPERHSESRDYPREPSMSKKVKPPEPEPEMTPEERKEIEDRIEELKEKQFRAIDFAGPASQPELLMLDKQIDRLEAKLKATVSNPSLWIREKVLTTVLSNLDGLITLKDLDAIKSAGFKDNILWEIEKAKKLRKKWKTLKKPKSIKTIKGRQDWYLRHYVPFQSEFREYFQKGSIGNPDRVREMYRNFHSLDVDKTFKAKIPTPRGKLEPISEIDHLVYVCSKWSKNNERNRNVSYIHRWKKKKMVLVQDRAGNYFIAGKCRIISTGINDWNKKKTWSADSTKVKTPKKVVYLGILPELKAGKVYSFTDTMLCTDGKGEQLFIVEITRARPSHPEEDNPRQSYSYSCDNCGVISKRERNGKCPKCGSEMLYLGPRYYEFDKNE